jgi:hypothetical protein
LQAASAKQSEQLAMLLVKSAALLKELPVQCHRELKQWAM